MSDSIGPWPTLPLGSLAAEMCLGKMLDKEKNRGTLQPYLRNINVRWFSFELGDLKEMRFEQGDEIRYQLRPGDLVICEGGEPGRAAVWKGQIEKAKIQKALHRVRFRADEYDPLFAMYYLYYGTITNLFESHYTGTTIKHLTGQALSRIHFPIPPVPEQRRIVAKIEELISDLDTGVVTLERVRANLKQYRAAVLKAAVEGKLTEDWRAQHPDTEPASVLLERILVDRRRQWEQAQLAKFAQAGKQPPKGWQENYPPPEGSTVIETIGIPATWTWASLDQVCPIFSDCPHRTPRYSPTGYPALRPRDVVDGKLDLDRSAKVSLSEYQLQTSKRVPRPGDVIYSRELSFGWAVTVPEEPAICMSQGMALMRPADDIDVRYFVYTINSPTGREQAKQAAVGTAHPHINLGDIKRYCLPLPPRAEQTEIFDEIERRLLIVDEIGDQVEANLKRAARLRQGILKRAFEGRLVPQDPTDEPDEPAEKLLEPIRQQRQPATKMYNGRLGTRRARRPRRTSDPVLPFPQDDGSGQGGKP